jgi:hypothetical protein
MRARWRVSALAASVVVGVACGGGGSSGPSTSDLTGTWNATKVEFISTTGLGTVDLIASGATVTLVFNADHSFQYTVTPAAGGAQVMTGAWQMMGIDLMRITPTGGSWYWGWDLTLSGNTLHLSCDGAMDVNNGIHAGYDFNHDGVWEPAKWDLVFTR